jgi:general secretion pathway protein G
LSKRVNKRRRAFSLMEMMIVVIIIGLLSSLVLPNIIGKGEEAKKKLTCVQIKNLEQSLSMFYVDNGRYPTTQESLKALIKNPNNQKYPNYSRSGYLGSKKLPKDAYGKEFVYSSSDGEYTITSVGADSDITLDSCE